MEERSIAYDPSDAGFRACMKSDLTDGQWAKIFPLIPERDKFRLGGGTKTGYQSSGDCQCDQLSLANAV